MWKRCRKWKWESWVAGVASTLAGLVGMAFLVGLVSISYNAFAQITAPQSTITPLPRMIYYSNLVNTPIASVYTPCEPDTLEDCRILMTVIDTVADSSAVVYQLDVTNITDRTSETLYDTVASWNQFMIPSGSSIINDSIFYVVLDESSIQVMDQARIELKQVADPIATIWSFDSLNISLNTTDTLLVGSTHALVLDTVKTSTDTFSYATGAVATSAFSGNDTYTTFFVDATTPNATTGTQMGVGYQVKAASAWYGPMDDAVRVKDSLYSIDADFTSIRGKLAAHSFTHGVADSLRLIFYGVNTTGRVITSTVIILEGN